MDLTADDLAPLLRGHLELERTERGVLPHRLPTWAREQCPDAQLSMVEAQPAGVRLVLRTTARWIELDVIGLKREYVGVPRRPDGVFELAVGDDLAASASVADGDVVTIDLSTGSQSVTRGPAGTLRYADLPAGEKVVTIWLPHDETVELVALRADAEVAPGPAPSYTWVHHGSSISQGSNAGRPTATWPVSAARRAGVDLVNLGLGGSALLDPFVARVIRDLDAPDLISVKLGINIVNADLMRRRAFGPAVHGFLDMIREGHPDTPLLLVGPLFCGIHESTPGPAAFDPEAMARGQVAMIATGDPAEVPAGRLTLQVIRDELAKVAAQRNDPHLRLIDGLDLFGAADAERHPLPDNLHLGEDAHAVVGSRFAEILTGLR